MVVLVTTDERKFTVKHEDISLSNMLNKIISEDDEEETEDVNLNIAGETLEKILEYCKYYKTDPMNNIEKPLKSVVFSELVQHFYANFIDNLETSILNDVLLASHYLEIIPLQLLCCAKVGAILKDKTPHEIRKMFGSENEENDENHDT